MTLSKEDSDTYRFCFNFEELDLPHHIAGVRGFRCDGILFFPDRNRNRNWILLCNPAIREFKLLRNSCFGSNLKTQLMVGFDRLYMMPLLMFYKVVRVVSLYNTDVGAPVRSTTMDELYYRGVCFWLIREKLG